MNWAVPVFFIITGYCILSKQEYTYRYCFKHVRKYVVILAAVGFLFALMEAVFNADTVSVSIILIALQNVVSGNLWDHMWYLYALIGVYLVLPVLHTFMSSGKENRLVLTGLLFLFTIVLPAIEHIIEIGVTIPFEGYLFYVCFGGMVAKGDFSKKQSFCVVLSGLIAAVYVLVASGENAFGYRSFTISLIACTIFTLFATSRIGYSKTVAEISKCTLWVYLIHPCFINVAVKVLKLDFLSYKPYVKLTVFYVAVCLISFATVWFLRRIFLEISRRCVGKSSNQIVV